MLETQAPLILDKKIPSDLATIARSIANIGGTYMLIDKSIAYYQSRNHGLRLEFSIDSLTEHQDLKLCCRVDRKVSANFNALSKGEHQVTYSHDPVLGQHLFSNQHSIFQLNEQTVTLFLPIINNCIQVANPIGPPVNIDKRESLTITGKERWITLIIRGGAFSGIVNKAGEYFFTPMFKEEMGGERIGLKCSHFLHVGREQYTISMHKKGGQYLLLTQVNLGTGITCKILEHLSSQ